MTCLAACLSERQLRNEFMLILSNQQVTGISAVNALICAYIVHQDREGKNGTVARRCRQPSHEGSHVIGLKLAAPDGLVGAGPAAVSVPHRAAQRTTNSISGRAMWHNEGAQQTAWRRTGC